MSFEDTLRQGTLQGWLDNPSAGGTIRFLTFDMFDTQPLSSPLIPAAPVPVLSLPEQSSASFVEWGGPATNFNFEGLGG